MGSVTTLPVRTPSVSVKGHATSATGIDVSVTNGCFFFNFPDQTQRDAFSSGLCAMGVNHDLSGDKGIRTFQRGNR